MLKHSSLTKWIQNLKYTLVATLPYIWKTWGHCFSISGENCGLLDAEKCVRETTCQLRIDHETICRLRDIFRSTGENWKTKSDIGKTSRDVRDFKTATFLRWPRVKCPELCYFTLIFRKPGIKLQLTLKRMWPKIQNYFCVFRFWSRASSCPCAAW